MLKVAVAYTNNQQLVGMWDDLCRAYSVECHTYDFPLGSWSVLDLSREEGRVVWFDPDGDILLEDLEPFADDVYVFGSDDCHNELPKGVDVTVRLKTPKQRPLWSPCAGAIAISNWWKHHG